jgi:hypothetical protein
MIQDKNHTSQEVSEVVSRPSSRITIYLLGFFIPLYSLSVNIFVQWSWYKILPFVLIVLIVLQKKRGRPLKDVFELAVILTSYLFIITFVNYLLNIETGNFHYAIESGQYYLRTYGHMIVQFVIISASLLQLFLFAYFIKAKNDVDTFVRGFIDGNIANVMVGFVQYGMYKLNIFEGWLTVYSGYSLTGEYFRMSGLGGEPRHFGALVSLALLIIFANNLSFKPIALKNNILKSGILTLGLLLSLSTSAWLGFASGLLIMVMFSGLNRIKRLKGVLVLTLCFFVLLMSSVYFRQTIEERLFSRIKSLNHILYLAPKDGLAVYLIKENPWRLLVGMGAGGSDFYVMKPDFLDTVPEEILQAGIIRSVHEGDVSNSVTPSSFFIKYVTEYGIIGVILMLLLVITVIRKVKTTRYRRFMILISVAVLAASVPSSMILVYVYFTFLSVLYGFYYHQRTVTDVSHILGKTNEKI